MKTTYIVDGNSLLFRAYYSTAFTGNLMSNKDGIPTNAIYGFHNLMKTIKDRVNEGDHLFVAFDTGKPTKRKEEFKDYKAQRKKIDEALVIQMPIAREMLDSMNIFHDEKEGYEGDDLCGSIIKYALDDNQLVHIYTSDKDFLQLCSISENVEIEFLKKGLTETIIYNSHNMHELFGLNADQITDYKGIAGDISDNYKGIAGIGDKTAKKLLNEHSNLEELITYCSTNLDNKTNLRIYENREDALFFKKLAIIDTTLDINDDYIKSIYTPYEKNKLKSFYLKYQFNSFLKNIDKLKDIKDENEISLFSINENKDDFEVINIKKFSEVKNKENLSLCYISSCENENISKLIGFSLCNDSKVYFLKKEDAINDEDFKNYLKSDLNKSVYDLKGLEVLLINNNLPSINNVNFDFLLATYLLDPDIGQNKDDVFFSYHIDLNSYKDSSCIAYFINKLKDDVITRLKKDYLYNLMMDVELPLSKVLAKMEIEGFPIDLNILKEIDEKYSAYYKKLEKEIKQYANKDFNISSPKQLEEVLFIDMGFQRKKNEKGTSIEVLKSHINDHPIFSKIIEYRLYGKLISGYTKSLPKHVSSDNKIHALYNQALTTTGRLSMSEPNLQNISIKNEEGKIIRKAFYYKEDNIKILSLDYSQIELRMLSSIANIKLLQELFLEGDDIHKATASKVFNVPLNDVTPLMRRKAKAVNFGIVYGISPFGLSEQLDIPVGEAKQLIEQFKNTFEGLEKFQSETIEFAKKNQYVTTILGRRRYLKDINSSNFALRSFSQRAATNAVIQGSAADLIKIGMIKCQKLLDNYKSKIILQIHDELLFKIYDDEKEELVDKLIYEMEHALNLKVPLKVDGDLKKTWYEVH